MTDRVRAGGKRRIDRVLDPSFLQGADDLSTEELRRRRDEARAESEYLSFLRRLLQARLDILRAERDGRRGGSDRPVVERLSEILAGPETRSSRGAFVNVVVPEEELLLARRRVEQLVSDAALSDLPSLSDDALEEAIRTLEAEERAVSEDRAAVFAVVDALQGRLKDRYRADPGEIPEVS